MRLGRIVAVDAAHRRRRPQCPVAVVERPVAEEVPDPPPVHLLACACEPLLDLLKAASHPRRQFGLLVGVK